MTELVARARLFAAVEGGSTFWSREVFSNGASYVLDRVLSGGYDPIKYARTIEKLKLSNADELLQSISNAGATFLTPEDATWPQSVSDLAAPPIGLVNNMAFVSHKILPLALLIEIGQSSVAALTELMQPRIREH
ncbi:MAG: hypothetical protein RIR63_670 [Actinomycetota bacterium]